MPRCWFDAIATRPFYTLQRNILHKQCAPPAAAYCDQRVLAIANCGKHDRFHAWEMAQASQQFWRGILTGPRLFQKGISQRERIILSNWRKNITLSGRRPFKESAPTPKTRSTRNRGICISRPCAPQTRQTPCARAPAIPGSSNIRQTQ